MLATWRQLLDSGRMQDGEPYLAATARPSVARLSTATAQRCGVAGGGGLAVTTPAGSITLPLVVTDMPDHVVWLPETGPGCDVGRDLGVAPGATVSLGPPQPAPAEPERGPLP